MVEERATMASLIFQSLKCSQWWKMSSKRSTQCSITALTFISEVTKSLQLAGTKDLQSRNSWQKITLLVMVLYRCIGENSWNQCSLQAERWFSGEMMGMISQLLQMRLSSSGEVRLTLQKVTFFQFSHCQYNQQDHHVSIWLAVSQ